MTSSSSWKEWSNFVLKELERLNESYNKLDAKISGLDDKLIKRISCLDKKVNMLYIKVAGLGATVGVVVSILINVILRSLVKQ